MFALQQIDHVALIVTDLKRSIAWYQEILGLHRRFEDAWGDRPAMLCAGSTCVALFAERSADTQVSAQSPLQRRIGHLALRAAYGDFLAAEHALKLNGISFELEDHGISRSIYFDDPDGHRLEITTYELPKV